MMPPGGIAFNPPSGTPPNDLNPPLPFGKLPPVGRTPFGRKGPGLGGMMPGLTVGPPPVGNVVIGLGLGVNVGGGGAVFVPPRTKPGLPLPLGNDEPVVGSVLFGVVGKVAAEPWFGENELPLVEPPLPEKGVGTIGGRLGAPLAPPPTL